MTSGRPSAQSLPADKQTRRTVRIRTGNPHCFLYRIHRRHFFRLYNLQILCVCSHHDIDHRLDVNHVHPHPIRQGMQVERYQAGGFAVLYQTQPLLVMVGVDRYRGRFSDKGFLCFCGDFQCDEFRDELQ